MKNVLTFLMITMTISSIYINVPDCDKKKPVHKPQKECTCRKFKEKIEKLEKQIHDLTHTNEKLTKENKELKEANEDLKEDLKTCQAKHVKRPIKHYKVGSAN